MPRGKGTISDQPGKDNLHWKYEIQWCIQDPRSVGAILLQCYGGGCVARSDFSEERDIRN